MLEASFIINLIIVIVEIIVLSHIKEKINIFKYYTYLQNFLLTLTSLIYCIFLLIHFITNNQFIELVKGLRYIATCGVVSTTFIFVVFLQCGKRAPITKDDFIGNFNHIFANIILHYICPLLSLISFVVFEREIILNSGLWTMIVAIPSCLYWLIYIILTSTKVWKEPYDFTYKKKIWEVLTMILIPLSFILISFIIWNIK
jgi:hypothetical protein